MLMTGGNMKSELLTEPKLRSDEKQGIQRSRRLTKSHAHFLENGEYDPELTMAIQESLKLARQNDSNIRKDFADDQKMSKNVNNEVTELRHENNNCPDLAAESSELKSLLLLHIDLSNHQQEIIVKKDREIKNLESEKDALQCRLERMERRMSLLKQKEESAVSPRTRQTSAPSRRDATPPTNERPGKRKSTVEPTTVEKRFVSDRRKSDKPSERRAVCESPRLKTVIRQAVTNSGKTTGNEDAILRTDNPYYMRLLEPPALVKTMKTEAASCDSPDPDNNVEIPSWKFRSFHNCYQLEGTENITDEAYIKRHQRLEIDEKRRKRWDLQRLREQRMVEKLIKRDKRADQNADNNTSLMSFYPRIEEVTHIEVNDRLPVMAFGHPVPCLTPLDFELPPDLGKYSNSPPDPMNRGRGRQKRK